MSLFDFLVGDAIHRSNIRPLPRPGSGVVTSRSGRGATLVGQQQRRRDPPELRRHQRTRVDRFGKLCSAEGGPHLDRIIHTLIKKSTKLCQN